MSGIHEVAGQLADVHVLEDRRPQTSSIGVSEVQSREDDVAGAVDDFNGEVCRLQAVELGVDQCSGRGKDKGSSGLRGSSNDVAGITCVGPEDILLRARIVDYVWSSAASRSSAWVVLRWIEDEAFVLPVFSLAAALSNMRSSFLPCLKVE